MLLVLLTPTQMNNQRESYLLTTIGKSNYNLSCPYWRKDGFKRTSFINFNVISQYSKLPSPFALIRIRIVMNWNDMQQLKNGEYDLQSRQAIYLTNPSDLCRTFSGNE